MEEMTQEDYNKLLEEWFAPPPSDLLKYFIKKEKTCEDL